MSLPDYYREERRDMLRYVPTGVSRILDVGCGAGRFGALLKERPGTVVWGIEPVALAAEAARRVLDRVVCSDFLAAATGIGERFDVVVFNDVLEHMPDPESALTATHSLLEEGGIVVASLPNVRYARVLWQLAVRGEWRYEDSGVLDRTHLRFFTVRSARRLFAECGFTCDVVAPMRWRSSPPFRIAKARLAAALGEIGAPQIAVVARPHGQDQVWREQG